jgi:light-regulated signal transduction histidine kinase (bacteriophytochrome)
LKRWDGSDKELVFQNDEKEKRAAELVIANKELVFQNDEKEKRAAELVIANEELAFQNDEKEKRAAELAGANKELKKAELHIIELNIGLEQKILERTAQLEAAIKELESFSYSVSHDLRAPLRAINGFTRVIVEDYAAQLDDDAKGFLEEIISNSKKMGALIDNLLEFSRIAKQNVSMININIGQMVQDIIDDQDHDEQGRKIKIKINNLKDIRGDKNMIRQVFINLISNACKYTSKNKEALIEIGSYPENNTIVFYVKDNGAGFDMKYYDKLFGVFQRLHSDTEFEGTGVGLAIVDKIVTKHGGKVWAVGKVNGGATFYVSLPMHLDN